MKKIIGYLNAYITAMSMQLFIPSALVMAVAVFCNYRYNLNGTISNLPTGAQYLCWSALFLLLFAIPYLLTAVLYKKPWFKDPRFLLLLVAGPALFAWKMTATIEFSLSPNPLLNSYWNYVLYWPLKLFVMVAALVLLWRLFNRDIPFYGTGIHQFNLRPYLWMLLIMVPLIATASTQPDFLATYPKLYNLSFLAGEGNIAYKLLYELSYGSDFISIELFFRGFLVLAFVKWAGKDAILPMALFYCTIHFGKPLGECISSFFGGLLLGVVTYHTQTIWGGLLVHVGIAWLMELGGYFGHIYFL